MIRNTFIPLILSTLAVSASMAKANDEKLMQFYLNQMGFNSGAVDGDPGRKTKTALRKFYASNSDIRPRKIGPDSTKDVLNVAKKNHISGFHYGLCAKPKQMPKSSSIDYSDAFSLANHKRVITKIPQYRSFSFGATDQNIGGPVSPEIKGVGDLNNDGIDDLVIDYYETSVPPIFLLGTETGQFKALEFTEPKAARRHIRNGEFADINADGFLDFVGFTTGDPAKSWVQHGHDTGGKKIPRGEPDILLINDGGEGFHHVRIPEIRRNDWNHGGTTADLNGDGLIDIIPLSEGEQEKTAPIINKGGKEFAIGKYEYSKEVSYFLTSDIDSADFNNDGYQDLVVAVTNTRHRTPQDNNSIGTIRVIYGDGDFDFRDNLEVKFGKIWLTDKDGQSIVNNFSGKAKPGASHDPSKIQTGSSNVEAIDVDGDGHVDILEGQYFTVSGLWSGSGFKYYRNTGDCFYDATDEFFPNQKTNRNFKANIFTRYIHNFSQSDINNDGLMDIILQTDGANSDWAALSDNKGFPYVFINVDNKEFLPVDYLVSDVSGLIGMDDIVPGDFNGDGLIDLLGIYSTSSGTEIRAFYEQKPIVWDFLEDTYAGAYRADWFLGNVNQNNKLEFMGSEALNLAKGEGSFSGTGSFQPSANFRKNLTIKYRPNGEISIKGPLDLFDPGRSVITTFEGILADQRIETFWEEGDLIVVKLKKLLTSEKVVRLNWYISLNNKNSQSELEAHDTITFSGNGSLVSSLHKNVTTDGIGGWQKLTYSLRDNVVKIYGTVTVLGDEQIFINIEEPFETGKATIIFGRQDKLVISWSD